MPGRGVFSSMRYTENEHTELKRTISDSLPKEIVAFLNSDGGTIYIGVEDDGSIKGVDDLDGTLKKLADLIEFQILPDCRELVSLGTRYENGRHVVEIDVQPGQALFYIRKYGRSAMGCYMRTGSTCRAMTEDQINRLQMRYLSFGADITEMPGRIASPSFQILKIMLAEKGFTVSDDTFEQNLKLRTSDGRYNRQADLLCDKNELSIKVVRFAGRDKGDGILRRNEYGGKCLILAMLQAYDFCSQVLNETAVSFSDGVRQDHPLFSRKAFREAWFNACLHNLWADGTPPAIYFYTDRLEIISTGGLPLNLSKEDFFKGVSKPVNEELARLFIRLNLMEQTGYGVPLIVKEYGRDAFEFLDGFIRVTIPFNREIDEREVFSENPSEKGKISENISGKTSEKVSEKGTVSGKTSEKISGKKSYDTCVKILNLILEHPDITLAEIARQTGRTERAVSYNIRKLQDEGRLTRIGGRKSGCWQVNHNPG